MQKTVAEKVQLFFSSYKTVSGKKGAILVRPNDPIDSIFFIQKGLIRQYSITQEGEEVTLHIFEPGSYIPILLAISNLKSQHFFQAMTPFATFKAPATDVLKFVKSDTDVLYDLTKRFAEALSKMLIRLENLSSLASFSKVSSILLYLAKRFGRKDGEKIFIEKRFTHHDIATWTGLTRETVSRNLEKLEKQKVISYNDSKIVIHEAKRLKSETVSLL